MADKLLALVACSTQASSDEAARPRARNERRGNFATETQNSQRAKDDGVGASSPANDTDADNSADCSGANLQRATLQK